MDHLQSTGGRGVGLHESGYQESLLSGRGDSNSLKGSTLGEGKGSTIVHVTASSVSDVPVCGQKPVLATPNTCTSKTVLSQVQSDASTLLGQDSAELLHDYARLFCPQLGSKEAESLGFCVDGERGDASGGRDPCTDRNEQVQDEQKLRSSSEQKEGQVQQQVRHSQFSMPPVLMMHQHSQHTVQPVCAMLNSMCPSMGPSMGHSMNLMHAMQGHGEYQHPSSPFLCPGGGPVGGHENLRVRTQMIHQGLVTPPLQQVGRGDGIGGRLHSSHGHASVERAPADPPLSWAMRVSSPRPLDAFNVTGDSPLSQEKLGTATALASGEYAADANDMPPPEILVGIDGQYQPYCKQIITPALNVVTSIVLGRLRDIQQEIEASMLGQPGVTKASIPRKFYCSLKEVAKVAKICKLLVVAPDIKPSPTAHIKPVKILNSLIEDADQAGVPYVFALSRRGIGQIFGRDKNMSIMALMDLDPVRVEVGEMLEEASLGRRLWEEREMVGAVGMGRLTSA